MNKDETCGCCGSSNIMDDACGACGAGRYEDVDGRVYWEPGANLVEVVEDDQGNYEKKDNDMDWDFKDGVEGDSDDDSDGPEAEKGECKECDGTGTDSESGEDCEACDGTGEEQGDDDENVEIPPVEQVLGEDDDPYPDLVTILVLKIGKKKIHAIKWLRAVTKLRDGHSYGLKEAKLIADQIQEGKIGRMTCVHPAHTDTILMAAEIATVTARVEQGENV